MKKKISGKTIFNVSVILISLVMLGYFCLSENGLVELSKNFKNLDKGWLIMALLSQALNIAIDAYMTYILVKSSVDVYKRQVLDGWLLLGAVLELAGGVVLEVFAGLSPPPF